MSGFDMSREDQRGHRDHLVFVGHMWFRVLPDHVCREYFTAVRTCVRNRCSSRSALRGMPIPRVTFAIMMQKNESNVDLAGSQLTCATRCLPRTVADSTRKKTSEVCVRTRLWCWGRHREEEGREPPTSPTAPPYDDTSK